MKHTKTSWNASIDLELMDTFLSLPYSKRWIYSQAAKQWWKFADWVEGVGRLLDPREVHVNERLLEIPFVLQRLPKTGRILDVGCTSSALSLQLACLGYQVIGVDLRRYPFEHPNLEFYQGDILHAPIPSASQDGAIVISALEHMGLGAYGDAKGVSDESFLNAIAQLVKPDGAIWVTVPFGRAFEGTWYRVYDSMRLTCLLSHFQVVEKLFARRLSLLSWQVCTEEDLADASSEHFPMNGVAMVELRR
jgi:SAM-dependent methyltransferase